MQGLVCQTSEFGPSWVGSDHCHYFYPCVSNQNIISYLDFGKSLFLTDLPAPGLESFYSHFTLQPKQSFPIRSCHSPAYKPPIILSIKSRCFTVALIMTCPLLFSLTSSHTPLHFIHSVPATLNLLFLDYIEFILAPGLCMPWNVLCPDSGMALHPHFFQSSVQISLPWRGLHFLLCLHITYLYLTLNHLLVHAFMCTCMCVCFHF